MISEEQHHKVKYDFSIYGLLLLYAILLFFTFLDRLVFERIKDRIGIERKKKNKIRSLYQEMFLCFMIFLTF